MRFGDGLILCRLQDAESGQMSGRKKKNGLYDAIPEGAAGSRSDSNSLQCPSGGEADSATSAGRTETTTPQQRKKRGHARKV